jgi:hypothetical protein
MDQIRYKNKMKSNDERENWKTKLTTKSIKNKTNSNQNN